MRSHQYKSLYRFEVPDGRKAVFYMVTFKTKIAIKIINIKILYKSYH